MYIHSHFIEVLTLNTECFLTLHVHETWNSNNISLTKQSYYHLAWSIDKTFLSLKGLNKGSDTFIIKFNT